MLHCIRTSTQGILGNVKINTNWIYTYWSVFSDVNGFFLNGRQKHSGCHFSIPHLLTFSPAASKRKCTVFNGESFRRAVVGVRTRTHQGMGDRPIDGHGLNEGGLITRDRKSGSSRCCRRLGRRTSICRFYKYLGSVFMTFTWEL